MSGLRDLVPRALRARVWRLLRTDPVLSGLTRRLETRWRRSRPPAGLGVPAGRGAPEATAAAPVVVVLGLGLSDDALAHWLDVVGQAQAGVAFRPLWLLDSPRFATVLSRGWAVDHVMPRTVHEALPTSAPWDGYVGERVQLWRARTDDAPVLVLPTTGGATAGGATAGGATVEADVVWLRTAVAVLLGSRRTRRAQPSRRSTSIR